MNGQKFHSNRLFLLAAESISDIAQNNRSHEVPILLSAISVEAFVNEIPIIAQENREYPFLKMLLDDEAERNSTLFKIQIIHFAFTGKQLDKGSRPFQDVQLLFELRNMIVHLKPEAIQFSSDIEDGEPIQKKSKIVSSFISRGIIKEHANFASGWTDYLLVRPVAEWAVNTALQTMKWISDLPPKGNFRNYLKAFSVSK